MSRATRVHNVGTVARYSEALALLHQAGDCVLIVRGVERAFVMACPDGCGETLTINLDRRTGPAWKKFQRNGALTVYPSVWRESGCRAHFIIWKNRILWCGRSEEPTAELTDEELTTLTLAKLSTARYVHYELIAEALDAIPWDVYWVCKELVRLGCALPGKPGMFRATGTPKPAGGFSRYA